MQQRQPRLGDILDDYCPRERRLTNHVVVAMVGDTVKQTRCSTCDSDHEYKHASLPRRKKSEQAALYTQVLAAVTPKKMVPDSPPDPIAAPPSGDIAEFDALFDLPEEVDGNQAEPIEEGPAHRRLIRAQLPRHEGQVSIARQAPDFTIRQPNPGRPKRFGARNARGPVQFQGNHPGGGNGHGNSRGAGGQHHGGRPQGGSHAGNRPGGGRNRSK